MHHSIKNFALLAGLTMAMTSCRSTSAPLPQGSTDESAPRSRNEIILFPSNGPVKKIKPPLIETHEMVQCPDSVPCRDNLCDCCGIVRLSGGYVGGSYIGLNQQYGQFGVLLAPPPRQGTWFPFADLNAYRLTNRRWAASAGLGARFLDCCHGRIWGLNGYWDYRETHMHHRHYFDRVGFGFESLGEQWDFRINTYIPVGPMTLRAPRFFFRDYMGPFVSSAIPKTERQFGGADAEIGTVFGCCDNRNCGLWTYVAIGPYYYRHPHWATFFGGQARIELHWSDYLSVELLGTHDHHFHSRGQVRALLTIPFDKIFCSSADRCECRVLCKQPIKRSNVLFYESQGCCEWEWNWDDHLPYPDGFNPCCQPLEEHHHHGDVAASPLMTEDPTGVSQSEEPTTIQMASHPRLHSN